MSTRMVVGLLLAVTAAASAQYAKYMYCTITDDGKHSTHYGIACEGNDDCMAKYNRHLCNVHGVCGGEGSSVDIGRRTRPFCLSTFGETLMIAAFTWGGAELGRAIVDARDTTQLVYPAPPPKENVMQVGGSTGAFVGSFGMMLNRLRPRCEIRDELNMATRFAVFTASTGAMIGSFAGLTYKDDQVREPRTAEGAIIGGVAGFIVGYVGAKIENSRRGRLRSLPLTGHAFNVTPRSVMVRFRM